MLRAAANREHSSELGWGCDQAGITLAKGKIGRRAFFFLSHLSRPFDPSSKGSVLCEKVFYIPLLT